MSKAWKDSDRKGWRRIRERILARDGYCCQSCGETDGKMHIDHIVPKRLGGSDLEENLQVLCQFCNLRKGGRFFEQYRDFIASLTCVIERFSSPPKCLTAS